MFKKYLLTTTLGAALWTTSTPVSAENCNFVVEGDSFALVCQEQKRIRRRSPRITLLYDGDWNFEDRAHRRQNWVVNDYAPLTTKVRVIGYSQLGNQILDEEVSIGTVFTVRNLSSSIDGSSYPLNLEVYDEDGRLLQYVRFELDKPVRIGDEFGGFSVWGR